MIVSDVPCARLDGVAIAVGAPGEYERTDPAAVTDTCRDVGTSASEVGTLVLVPGDAKDGSIGVRVVAGIDNPAESCTADNSYSGCIVARRLIRYLPNERLTLPISLREACKDAACDEASTCVNSRCASATVDDPAQCRGAGCSESTLYPDAGVPSDAGMGGTVGIRGRRGRRGPPVPLGEQRAGGRLRVDELAALHSKRGRRRGQPGRRRRTLGPRRPRR